MFKEIKNNRKKRVPALVKQGKRRNTLETHFRWTFSPVSI